MLDTKSTFDDLVHPLRRRPRAGRAHPRQPLLPEHLRRPLGHPGVHGDGEALRAPRRRRLRPGRGRHAADPQRPRLPRRPPPAHPLPRPPPLPGAHGAHPRRDEGGQRGRPGVRPQRVQGGRRRGVRRRHRLLPGLRGHGGRASRSGPSRCSSLLDQPGHRLRAGGLAPPRHRGRGPLLRRQAGRGRHPGAPPWSSTACTRTSPTSCPRRCASGPRRSPAPTSAASTPTWPTSPWSASREEEHLAGLAEQVAPAPVVRVPFLRTDVHDLDGLGLVGAHLFGRA